MTPTKSKKLFITSQRMLDLMDYAISNSLVESQKDWCERIKFNSTNLAQIRSGKQGFTDEQKLAAAKLCRADMNWIFGLDATMIKMNHKISPIQLIKEGVRMLEKK